MEVRKFEIHHLAQLGRSKSGTFLDEFPDMNDRLKAYSLMGAAFTLFDDEQPVACGGVCIPWKGVGEAWLVPHEDAKRWGRAIVYAGRHWLREVVETERLHRLQAVTVKSYGIDPRWFRAMGFREEPQLLKKYTPNGKDCLLYAQTFERSII